MGNRVINSLQFLSGKCLFMACFVLGITGQISAQEIQTSVDTTQIAIGEQIHYQIAVETDSSSFVTFPKSQRFLPMTMVEVKKTDTSYHGARLHLLKEYVLTKFDSGQYVIPPQRIVVGQNEILTDSFQIHVAGVVVDTTKQKMFTIKPAIAVEEPYQYPQWVWWTLGGVIFIALVIFGVIYLWKKKEEAKRYIPPYEKAMLSLKSLDEGDLLETHNVKSYYSTLVDAARRYLDEKIDDRAMESTTSELIARLQLQKDSGKLNIEQQIIDDFEIILKRADLIKFARSRPGIITAKEDRNQIEKIITDTKKGIPQPTEEDILENDMYRQARAKKKKFDRIFLGIGAAVVLLILVFGVLVMLKGFSFSKGFGNDSKDLFKSEWITSAYGNPSIRVATPEVLVRDLTDSLPVNHAKFTEIETFNSGAAKGILYVALSTKKIKKSPAGTASDTLNVLGHMGVVGARNILIKHEEFVTAKGAHGQKLSGSFGLTSENGAVIPKEYVLVNFALFGGRQEVLVVYNRNDEYAKKIASRIINSIELIKPGQ